MVKLTYDVIVNGRAIANNVPTYAEAERIKGESVGATLVRRYVPVENEYTLCPRTPKKNAMRVQAR